MPELAEQPVAPGPEAPPVAAAAAGALAGGLAFMLGALFLGPVAAIAVGLAGAAVAWRRHRARAALLFAGAAALSALTLLVPLIPLLLGAALFAAGLLLAAAGRAPEADGAQSR